MYQHPDADASHAVAVGFDPPHALAQTAAHLGWPGLFLADEQRHIYQALQLDRAPLRRVYTPGTIAVYARALLHHRGFHLPTSDTRQLGGDAVVHDGTVVYRWRPRTPDDRVDPDVLWQARRW